MCVNYLLKEKKELGGWKLFLNPEMKMDLVSISLGSEVELGRRKESK